MCCCLGIHIYVVKLLQNKQGNDKIQDSSYKVVGLGKSTLGRCNVWVMIYFLNVKYIMLLNLHICYIYSLINIAEKIWEF